MKTVTINGKNYNLEFSFAAADESNLIQSMFKIVSGAYLFFNGEKGASVATVMLNGTAGMVGDLPKVCKQAFFAGLKEYHENITFDEAVELMKSYMKESKLNFNSLFIELKTQMEEDGFFELIGITEMLEEMSQDENPEKGKKQPKTPQEINWHEVIWENYFVRAVAVGIPYETFLHLNPCKLELYEEGVKIRKKLSDEEMWVMGRYVREAIMSTIGNSPWFKAETTPAFEYPEKPYLLQDESEELSEDEKMREVDKFWAQESARRANWRRTHPRQE